MSITLASVPGSLLIAVALFVGCASSSGGGSGAGGAAGGRAAAGGSTNATGGAATGGSTTGSAGGGGMDAGRGTAGSAGGSPAGGRDGTGGSAGGGGATVDRCGARPGLVFCDSFEADTPGAPPAPWTTTQTTAGQVSVDATNPAASGARSIHVAPTDNDYDTFLNLHAPSVLPVAGNKLYVRFYIRLAAGMTAKHNTLVRGDLFAAPGTGNNLLFGEDNQMIFESITGDAQAAMSNQSYYNDGKIGPSAPAGVWTCIELLLDHAAPAIDVWVNDVEVPDLHQTAWKIDAYDYLRFGFEKYGGPASDIWYDDIAIGTQKLGCN